MPTPILVASAHPAFGELLRLSLEKSSNYRVKLVRTGTEIFTAVNRDRFDIAIIDADIRDQPFVPMIQNLLARYPAMRIVIIPPESEAENHSIAGLEVDGFLQKPFYLPDLLQLVDRLLQMPTSRSEKLDDSFQPHAEVTSLMAPDWLQNRSVVEANLGRAVGRTSAQAVLILKENEPWAKAGKLEISALNELTTKLKSFYETPTQLHRLRFIRLESLSGDILFYSLTLILGYTLCTVYTFDTPLKVIRQEIIQLANAISSQPISEPAPVAAVPVQPDVNGQKNWGTTPSGLPADTTWVKETFSEKKSSTPIEEDPQLGKTRPLASRKDLGLH
jgi:DNA-binding response OmpR family regulator